ncbi:MAG: TolC family protein, partial [Myxococcota bacterium]|nr:TolC family protein [Myxococcota bacterium]
VATAQNPDYRVGLRFEVPIDRDPQRARVERAEISVTRAETALAQSENEVTYDLRELVVQLEKRQQILEASGRLVELAELKLSTEQEKYRSGLSTLAYVVQFQREFDSARIARQRAAFDVIVLRARIANTMGVLYREAGLEVR